MDYQIQIDHIDSYLRVEVSGTRKPGKVAESSLALWQKIAAICRTEQIDQILAVFNLEGERTLADSLKIIEGVQPMLWPNMMMAYVDSSQSNSMNDSMLEQLALSHNISFRIFHSESKAVQWLTSFPPC